MKLFEIHDQIEIILATKVDRETGEITDETCDELSRLDVALEDKALAVAAYLKGEAAEALAVRKVAAELIDRAEKHERRAERLRVYLGMHIPIGSEFRDARSVLKWRKLPPAVDVINEALIPPRFRTVIPKTTKPNKRAIAEALKAGKAVKGCALMPERHKLEVK